MAWRLPLAALALALAAPALALLGPVPARSRPATPNLSPLDGAVRRAMKFWGVPGAAVAVVRDGEVIYLKGFGPRRVGRKDPVTPDTLFPVASCTKGFTTTALAVLVGEGKLHWDDHVRDHVPFFRLSDPLADREVRLRDLLCHRTGLAPHNLLWYRSPWKPEEVVRRAGRLPLDRPFRTAFQYQSIMFTAAGFAIESASGTPWHDFVRKRLLEPLDMRGVGFTSTEAESAPDHASPHHLGAGGRPGVLERCPLPVPDAAGSLHASARDLAKWLHFQLGDGTAGGKRLVEARALAETHTPQMMIRLRPTERELFPDTVQVAYGLGWVIHDYRGLRLVSHGGATDGFRAHFTLVPEKRLGLVLLCNLHETNMNLALSNTLLDLLLGLPATDWNELHGRALARAQAERGARERARQEDRHPGTRPSRELAAYAGEYQHPAYGTVRVSLEEGILVWRWNSFSATLEHFHYDTFALPVPTLGPTRAIFTLDRSGAVTGLKLTGSFNSEFTRRARP
jgi:CubicO group peptidase (beta-lactamase class C family)